MPTNQLSELTNLLLNCPSLKSAAGRRSVIENLPINIQAALHDADNVSVKMKVQNLIQTCQNYPNGLNCLVEAIEVFDSGTIAFIKVQEFITTHNLLQAENADTKAEAKRSVHPLDVPYCEWLAEQVGIVRLNYIVPDGRGVPLEKIYVDSPTPWNISVEVKDWQITDWWLSHDDDRREQGLPRLEMQKEERLQPRRRPEELGYERAAFEIIKDRLQERIYEYRTKYLNDDSKYKSNKWEDGVHSDEYWLHLSDLAAACKQLVILGAPGSGKSTFARYLAFCLANTEAGAEPNINILGNWTPGERTPIYVELRRFVASTYFPKVPVSPTAKDMWAYIKHDLLPQELQTYADKLRADFEQGKALLILDGLDEIPYEEGVLKERRDQLKDLADALQKGCNKGSRLIITSRPYGYEGWKLNNFESVTITSFANWHREKLASSLFRLTVMSKENAEANAERLNEQLEARPTELKDRPLFVTLMALLYLKDPENGLPSSRAELYRESVILLLERWTESKGHNFLDILPREPKKFESERSKLKDELYAKLAALAYEVHSNHTEEKGTPDFRGGVLYDFLAPLSRGVVPELITYLAENAGLLVALGPKNHIEYYQFAHRSFQEYLAAKELINLCTTKNTDKHTKNRFDELAQLIEKKPTIWRAVGAFVGDIIMDTQGRRGAWSLIEDLLGKTTPSTEDGQNPYWWRVLMAATVAQEQKLYEKSEAELSDDEATARRKLTNRLVELLETAGALPPMRRAECGETLALLGDTRKGTGTRSVTVDGREIRVPYIEWCPIAKPDDGKFTMGSEEWRDKPRQQASLNYDFQMAKYLITYQQFQTFAESGEYDNPDWWEGFLEEYKGQELREQNGGKGSHPRDMVSWYQAVAFTRWWTAKLRAAGELKPDQEIRLPTEIEWEYAARGTTKWRYPYGNEFDLAKGNTSETGIGKTSVVGSFPDGKSRFDVLDMSGNLWEWCLNKYKDSPQTELSQIAIEASGDIRVLRGGSFNLGSLDASAVVRNRYLPRSGYFSVGVRVVVGVPL